MVRTVFSGEPISQQNLSQWRLGGFQDWLTRLDFFDAARNADASALGHKRLSADSAATVLAARYSDLILAWNGECTPAFEARARVLNGLCRRITELQREAHRPGHFDLDRPTQAPSKQVAASHSEKVLEMPGLTPGVKKGILTQ
jgi:hypothetical protein